jgi:acyl-CoA synthetase (AMP-forming)/AMP-acid ligase II
LSISTPQPWLASDAEGVPVEVELPRSLIGKVLRREVREKLAAL